MAFCLWDGAEQRALKLSQVERGYNPNRYTYTESGSKNHRGGIGTLHDSYKVVTVYSTLVENSGDQLSDMVYLLDYYFRSLLSRWTSYMYNCIVKHECHQILKSNGSTQVQHSLCSTTCVEAGIEVK